MNRHLNAQGPVGIFDSGVGGLSVWREIVRQLPQERTLYLADQAHVPYGPRALSEIRDFSVGIVEFLLSLGSKVIVIACNTASGAALQHLRAAYPAIPFVGMEPAVKPAAERTRTGAVGVLATPTTFQGPLFKRLVQRFGRNVKIYTQVCPGLVEAVEAGEVTNPQTQARLAACLAPLLAADIDQLVLGCTHYPFLQSSIQALAGPSVTVIDPAPAVARQVSRVLANRGLLNTSSQQAEHLFYTSGAPATLARLVQHLVEYEGRVQGARWQNQELRIA
ncbi:MAG: glutamate racemase [Anaerolineae bacterium]